MDLINNNYELTSQLDEKEQEVAKLKAALEELQQAQNYLRLRPEEDDSDDDSERGANKIKEEKLKQDAIEEAAMPAVAADGAAISRIFCSYD
ncbi:hypothetical protein THAOC_15799, partial [Thalassiosira oceanica]